MKFISKVWVRLIIMSALLLGFTNINAQSLELYWQLQTNGKIIAGPVIDDNNVYVGNEKGKFFSIDVQNGKVEWQKATEGNIQAKAVLIEDVVFFESANNFYALNKETGQEVWKYDTNIEPEQFSNNGEDYLYKLDPFDDKRSSGFVHGEIIYVGTSNGKILGLNFRNGRLEFSIDSDNNAPIRSTPLVHEGILYYGDWNGVVYAYDLVNTKLLWKKETYREKPYATFGGIASEFVLYQDKLFFGARNPMLNVLWADDGQKEWTYTDSDGGWIIGDPVILNDTLYIAGSDNYSMLAFGTIDGKVLWKHKRSKNIYVKPIVTKDWIIYTGGNSYNPSDAGEIVVLNRHNGTLITQAGIPSGVFSSPALSKDGLVICGSNDGMVFAFGIKG